MAPAQNQLPEEDITHLLRTINDSNKFGNLDLKQLGITPELIELHRRNLSASAHPFTDEKVSRILRNRLLAKSNLRHCRMSVAITGKNVNIRLESTAPGPGMLPWHVNFGGESWNTYSKDLSEALAIWAGARPMLPHLLQPGDFVQNEFWNELINLEEPLTRVKMPKLPSQIDLKPKNRYPRPHK